MWTVDGMGKLEGTHWKQNEIIAQLLTDFTPQYRTYLTSICVPYTYLYTVMMGEMMDVSRHSIDWLVHYPE